MTHQSSSSYASFIPKQLNRFMDQLPIVYDHVSHNEIKLHVEVVESMAQPYGYCHGGIYAYLAEEMGSVGGYFALQENNKKKNQAADSNVIPGMVFGTGLTCHHIGNASIGDILYCTAKPIHVGKNTQLWEIKIEVEAKTSASKSTSTSEKPKRRNVSLCRLTLQNVAAKLNTAANVSKELEQQSTQYKSSL
jgi:uncharacterized protein (TIGR00369 family)